MSVEAFSELARNSLRVRLESSSPTLGTCLFSWSPALMEVAGLSGLHFVRIDLEHGWRQGGELEHLIRAAKLAGTATLVRVDRGDPQLGRRVLEMGASGLVLADVTGAKELTQALRNTKFPPAGSRGYSGICHGGGWGGIASREWIHWSNTEPLIGVMVETVEAVEGIDELLGVEGLDFVMFGPADYAMSLGLEAPSRSDPRIADGLRRVTKAARSSGKHVMSVFPNDEGEIKAAIDLGVNMVEVSNDVSIARAAWQKIGKLSEFGRDQR